MSALERELRGPGCVEFLPGRLFYVPLPSAPTPSPSRHFFCIDNDLVYWNFFLDFGPLNLGHLYRFCTLLNNKLADPKLKDKIIYYYSGTHIHRRTNAAYLISAWCMLYMNKTPEEAFRPFRSVTTPFAPWHDATPTICTFQLTILDTLKGLYKARECGFFDFNKFDIDEYEHFEQVENGDLNWVLYGKFIAFAGPHATRDANPGCHSLCPEDYVPYFKKKGVTLVVRLNKKYYDAKKFTNHGIDHQELYFLDGSNPPDPILARFLELAETTPGAVAVHCKAGLGRTGSCIGCYMMKHYRFTAEEVIGWLRIVRPGSIIGPQQQFMKDSQARMWREGELYRARLTSEAGLARGLSSGGGGDGDSSDVDSRGVRVASTKGIVRGINTLSVTDGGEGGRGGGGGGAGAKDIGDPGQGESLLARRQHNREMAQGGSSGAKSPASLKGSFNSFLSSWK